MVSMGRTPEFVDSMRRAYGLDKPLWVQLGHYIANVARGDLGSSIYFRTPVLELVLSRLLPTVLLICAALGLALACGIVLGVASAAAPRGSVSAVVSVVTLVGYAAPAFWTSLVLLDLFAVKLGYFPSFGMAKLGPEAGAAARARDVASHLVLPAASLAVVYVGIYSRYVHAAMLEVLALDFIRTARAKGASELSLLFSHALRNAFLPIITLVGMQVGQKLAGSVLVERCSTGPASVSSCFSRSCGGTTWSCWALLMSCIIVVLANIATDFVYGLADPRIRTRPEPAR
jgi:peptide/nickel transport system permease protein